MNVGSRSEHAKHELANSKTLTAASEYERRVVAFLTSKLRFSPASFVLSSSKSWHYLEYT